jgi:phage N-6-adenine-methyltransferase
MTQDLANIGQLDAHLASITSPADAAQLARDFKAMAEAAGKRSRSANLALLAYAKAARRTGELLLDVPRTGGGKPFQQSYSVHGDLSKSPLQQAYEAAALDEAMAKRWQALAKKIAEDTWLEWCAAVESGEIDAALKGVISAAHVANNAGENEWYTPEPFIVAARDVMGDIDLDPASSEIANTLVGAHTFYSAEDDGLAQPWRGRVWMNPPYAQPLVDRFCARLAETFSAGDVSEACVLVNNATETAWFNRLAQVCAAICFPLGRVRFWQPGVEAAAPLQGQAIVYCGENPDRFADRFLHFGFVGFIGR